MIDVQYVLCVLTNGVYYVHDMTNLHKDFEILCYSFLILFYFYEYKQ